jgi:hypothetical protein
MVFDIDGTREAARQRALPQTDDLPPAFRRLADVCAPGYRGRKRGEVVRTRTTVAQAHSYQYLGSFGNRGNGRYEVIDFLVVLFGYAVSGERTLEAFYARLHPFAAAFMALFGRDRLPARSTLSRPLVPAFLLTVFSTFR